MRSSTCQTVGMYQYRVHDIVNVIDGDTVDACLDLGFGISATVRIRVANIDTPEVFGRNADPVAGPAATEFTTTWLAEQPGLTVQTFKGSASSVGIGDGAFGRWLGTFTGADGATLDQALRDAGHEKP